MKKLIKTILSVFGIHVYNHLSDEDIAILKMNALERKSDKNQERWDSWVNEYGYCCADIIDFRRIKESF